MLKGRSKNSLFHLAALALATTHHCVNVIDEVPALSGLRRYSVSLPLKDRARQGLSDFPFPNPPHALRDIPTFVEIIHVGDELHRIQRAIGQFLA